MLVLLVPLAELIATLGRPRFRGMTYGLVVLVIAVAVLVPMFQKNIETARRSPLQEQLDSLRNAITLHDSQNRPFTGLFTATQLSRYLSCRFGGEILDPWGNQIWIDATVGAIVCYGRDGRPGGTDEDADFVVRYKSAPRVRSTEYRGPVGLPAVGSALHVTFWKPLRVVADPVRDLALVLDRKRMLVLPLDGGWPRVENRRLGESGVTSHASLGGARWAFDSEASDLRSGRVVVRCTAAPTTRDANVVRFGAATMVDVRASVVAEGPDGGETSLSAIREAYEPGGPFDPVLYWPEAARTEGAFPSL